MSAASIAANVDDNCMLPLFGARFGCHHARERTGGPPCAGTHLSLEKDAPFSRTVERAGQILCRPILGGLHHQYVRL
jgi:hypothetical protein